MRSDRLGPLDPIYDVETQYGAIATGNSPGAPPLPVTINQGATQADPTSSLPVYFDVEFALPVTGFTNAGVVVTGTAGATTSRVSGSGTTYVVTVPGGPLVTINKAAGQADPATSGPIIFDVVFSESVTGFSTGDVTLSGTAPGTLVGTVSGSGATYTVSVTGMTWYGTVIAEIAAGVCVASSDGASNFASTSTDNVVSYAATSPPPFTIGLQAWYDAQDAGTFTFGSGGGGTTVMEWRDKSGNGFHVGNGNVATDGPFRNTTINGHPSVYMSAPYFAYARLHGHYVSVDAGWTFFIVAQITADDANNFRLMGMTDGFFPDEDFSSPNAIFGSRSGSTHNFNAGSRGVFSGNTPTAYTIGVPFLAGSRMNGTTVVARLNGSDSTASAATTPPTNAALLSIGRYTGAGAANINGSIGEVLLYGTSLSDSDRNAVEAYLTAKWGL